jgi:hypothetical protein
MENEMHLALVGGERTPPSPKLSGICPVCGDPMLAKCGTMRVHHWAHKGLRVCDDWWERELAWHREWKNRFPLQWQENIRFADNGEKHIADVRTEAGLVIEFQHSALKPAERAAREAFYGNMVWVVDGTRLIRDLPRFRENKDILLGTGANGIFTCWAPEMLFPKSWLTSSACVFFDFGADEGEPDYLWCLLPYRVGRDAIVIAMPRAQFITRAKEHAEIVPARAIAESIAKARELAALRQAQLDRQRASLLMMQQLQRQQWRGHRRRRF